MATQKKGCGFLIAAFVILLLGGGIAAYLGMGAFKTGKEFAENINKGETFVFPDTLNFTAEEDSEVTVWITSAGNVDFSGVEIEIKDTAAETTSKATKPGNTSNIGDQHFLAVFSVEKDKAYEVKATGATEGQTFRVSNVSSTAVFSVLGKDWEHSASLVLQAFSL